MADHTLRQLLKYRFDTFMARGGRSIFIALVITFVLSLLVIGSMRGLINWVAPQGAERRGGLMHQLYQTFNHLSDPGTMAYDINSQFGFKLTAILAGAVGIVILSSLIAFITTELDQKISQLKKGHSKVIEQGHTLILGWNERVVEIIRELMIANESEETPCVVILANRDKEEMDDYLNLNIKNSGNTRIVTRSGNVASLVNLDIVSVAHSKSVIVLGTCGQGATDDQKVASDTSVIKTVLALIAACPEEASLNIVVEVFDPRNRRIVEQIAPEMVSTIDTDEVLAKILVQTSRSVGLSVVYGEILSFDGCEMYFHQADWEAITFGQLAFRFPDGVPMGLRHASGKMSINPSPVLQLEPDDAVLILAQDDSSIAFHAEPVAAPRLLPLPERRRQLRVEKELLIGWTPKVEIILREYSQYVLPGSRIDIMLRSHDDTVRHKIERINNQLSGVEISLVEGDPLTAEGLIAVQPFNYDNIIILSQTSGKDCDDERTDSETIIILLLLRRIFDENRDKIGNTKLITEILDSENQPLVARTGVQDFIISNRFVSMVLAQISEDADIKRVYDDLFQEEGSEIYLKPAWLYFEQLPIEVTFADMMGIAQQRGEVCLGVKIKALEQMVDQNFGVTLIPEKNTMYTLAPDDALVVLAEDET